MYHMNMYQESSEQCSHLKLKQKRHLNKIPVLRLISRTSKKLFKSKEVERLLSESYVASAFIPGTRFEGTHPPFTTAGANHSFGYYPSIQQYQRSKNTRCARALDWHMHVQSRGLACVQPLAAEIPVRMDSLR